MPAHRPGYEQKRVEFLDYAATYISVAESARRADLSVHTVKQWLKDDDAFRKQYEEATETARGKLFGMLVDAAHGQGEFESVSMISRLRILERIALDLNPEVTGKGQDTRRLIQFQTLIPRNRYRELPDVEADVKELTDGIDT